MKEYIFFVIGILTAVSFYIQYLSSNSKSKVSVSENEIYLALRKVYMVPYLLAVFGDWLQGPYVYKLYSHYGFDPGQIAVLYVIGFASSAIFGMFVGSMADRCGRKKACLAFCLLYSICCLTKLCPNFFGLAFGRVCGGISTSILFSAFEAWYVCQHEKSRLSSELISSTFSVTTFWNGILAILAGLVAEAGAEWMDFGPVAPFTTAIPFLAIAAIFIATNWQENYGSSTENIGKSCFEGLREIFSKKNIWLLGLVQSMFESVIYIFVFIWTPVLETSAEKWPLGLVFSSFMVCIMLGSSLHDFLISKGFRPQSLLLICLITDFCSMLICLFTTNPTSPMPALSYVAFLILEISIGIYYPCIGYLRSQVIPESLRANIMNWFRAPFNVITCLVLLWLHKGNAGSTGVQETRSGDHCAFLLCAGMSLIGVVGSYAFTKIFREKVTSDIEEGRVDSLV